MTYQRSGEQNAVPCCEFLVGPYDGPKAKQMLAEMQSRLSAGEPLEDALMWGLLRHSRHMQRVGWCVDGAQGRDFTVNREMATVWAREGLAVREVFA